MTGLISRLPRIKNCIYLPNTQQNATKSSWRMFQEEENITQEKFLTKIQFEQKLFVVKKAVDDLIMLRLYQPHVAYMQIQGLRPGRWQSLNK